MTGDIRCPSQNKDLRCVELIGHQGNHRNGIIGWIISDQTIAEAEQMMQADRDAAEPLVEEPAGLWAVVEHRAHAAVDHGAFYVKGPGGFNHGSYWFALYGEDGYGWDQVINWPGSVRLVRDGMADS